MLFPIAVIGIVFGSALIFTKMIIDYKRDAVQRSPQEDKSLSTSELREIIDAAVGEAVAPLAERVERLEERRGMTVSDVEDVYGLDARQESETGRRTR